MRVLRLGFRLGLFQLSLGILGVLMLGLFNRLLIEEIGLPAAVVALAIGSQQLMGSPGFGLVTGRIESLQGA